MSSYMCSRTRSHKIKCGPSHTTTCTYRLEADAPWGRNLMLTKMRNQPSNSTLNQLSGRRTWSHCPQKRQPSNRRIWSHCHQKRFWLTIHTSLRYISMMLATSQTRLPTPTTFPTKTWTAIFESFLAKNFDVLPPWRN